MLASPSPTYLRRIWASAVCCPFSGSSAGSITSLWSDSYLPARMGYAVAGSNGRVSLLRGILSLLCILLAAILCL